MEAVVIAGHFGFAAAVKSRAPGVPLWALMLGSVWLDIVFVPLVVAGVETFQPLPGTTGGYGAVEIHADYTHSLVGAVVLSGLFGLIGLRWGRQAALVLAGVAFSHWILDLPMHHHDMPILPGHRGFLGFGLWSFPLLAAAIELALVLGGAFLYWRAAQRVAGARARLPAAVLLASGVVTLALNFAGL